MSVGDVILATGGIASGGIVGLEDGTLVETVLGLAVDGPTDGDWLLNDPFDPAGHPLETAGVRTDGELRPIAPRATDGAMLADNVRVVGSLLAGQRYLRDRSGDGVAVASGWFAGRAVGPASAIAVPSAGRVQ
jgi:glycerol-3-phosphate dehydrogenase subunit B